MDNEIRQTLNGLLDKEDNAAYEEAMQKAVDRYNITEKNRHPAKEVRAIGKAILDHDAEMVKGVRFNNQMYTPENGIVTFNQTSDTTTYAIRLASDLAGDRNIKLGSELVCNIRYMAIQITPLGDRLNYRTVAGTLTVDTKKEGESEWVTKHTQKNIVSQDEEYDKVNPLSYPLSLDLGAFCEEGAQDVRIRVSSHYEDENGITRTFYGDLVFNINAVNLVVKNMVDWSQRINASDGIFPFSFSVMGAVAKTLHVTLTGSNGTLEITKMYAANVQKPESNPDSWTQQDNANGILSHGVHTVTAWLTCSDGIGGTLSSDVVVNRFMVVNESAPQEQLTAPYLMLQQVRSVVTNYVRTVLSEYAVWVAKSAEEPATASTEPMTISVRITNAGDGDLDYTTEYYNSEMQVLSGTRYSIDTTVEVENPTGGEAPSSYQAYLRVFRYEGNNTVNFMKESIGSRFVVFTVDNQNDYSPVSGAHFYLNPKVRNNSEREWKSIINHQNQEVIPSVWSGFGGVNDAWVTDDSGVRVLRVLAGQSLNIGYEPWGAFLTNPSASMTMELDFAVRNITDEENPVINISQVVDGQRIGFVLKPLMGAMWTIGNQNENDQDFGFEEDVRTHLVLTVTPALVARSSDEFTWQTPNGKESNRPTAKVYINGKHKRAIQYSIETTGVWVQGEGHGGIQLGNEHCDLDIYGLRCYRGSALSAHGVVQNYIASRPTADEKNKIREDNDILDGNGRVSYAKVFGKGKRCLTLFGEDNYKINQDKKNGYPCYWRIDYFNERGEYVPELSGTIGKASYEAYLAGTLGGKKCLYNTAQGSTANTYWWNNEQTKVDKITYRITIPFKTVHEDFGWSPSMSDFTESTPAANPMFLNGEQIQGSSYSALIETDKDKVTIEVTDGWIDGGGMYHGAFYTSSIGAAKATKLVNKINYASPMQSHKMGATRLYNDVMKEVCKDQLPRWMRENLSARFAVLEDSFFFFNQPAGEKAPVFIGLSTFGQGKCDKPSWGYDKKQMCAFEGLNNNLPLCDFRVPADEDVVYDPNEEAYVYNGVNSFEYSLGATKEDGSPTDLNDTYIRRYINFIYTHDVRIEYYAGPREEFERKYSEVYQQATTEGASIEAIQRLQEMQTTKYWFREGTEAFHLVRFNFVSGTWVDAGVWTERGTCYAAGVRDLSSDVMTAATYEEWKKSEEQGDYSALNARFKMAIAKHFNDRCGGVLNKTNHQTHYNLINFFLAGTDNCSKNTYYTVDVGNGGVVWLYQDDLDTILKTDNNGRQTKVYFLSRYFDTYDYAKGYKKQKDYEGSASALFNVIEGAWETLDRNALTGNMRNILTVMSGLVNANDVLEGLDVSQRSSPYGCIHKYLFGIQKYFPAMAYNEQQRIRYDYPASWGYISYGNQARGVAALTQGIGDQLEAEMQYMKRRLALVCSYAAWGDFSASVNSGNTGLGDATDAFSITPGSGNAGGEYAFSVVPHQFIYPTGVRDRALIDPHERVAPGETYKIVVATAGNSIGGDSAVGLCAVNYYRSIGNVGNMVCGNNKLSVQGKRLVEFIAEPKSGSVAFAPKQIEILAPNLQKVSLGQLSTVSGSMDLRALSRLRYLDLSGTRLSTVTLPQTSFLSYARFGADLTSIDVRDMPNLTDCTLEGYGKLRSVSLRNVGFDTRAVARGVVLEGATLSYCYIDNIMWSDISPEVLSYLAEVDSCYLQGRISVTSGVNMNAVLKMALLEKFGNIDSEDNTLHVVYTVRSATGIDIYTKRFTITQAGDYQYLADIIPTNANNFSSLVWSITENAVGATIDGKTGVLHVPSVDKESNNSRATITATLNLISGDTLSSSIEVKLFNRTPKLGDFAYADGQFDDILHYGVEVVGWVYKVTNIKDLPPELRNMYLANEEYKKLYDEGRDLYEILVESNSELTIKTSDGSYSYSSLKWGIYPEEAATNGFTSEEISAVAQAIGAPINTQVTDITEVANVTKRGLTDESGAEYYYIKDFQAYDDAQPDGFKYYASDTAPSNWEGKTKTSAIVAHAKKILVNYIGEGLMTNEAGQTIWDFISADHIIPENNSELADLLRGLIALNGVNDRHTAMAYPAAFACFLYEPAGSTGKPIADLNSQYSKGQWYLPSSGDLVRQYIFLRNSRGLTPSDASTAVLKEYSDEDNPSRPLESTDARRPLYANLLKRASDAGKSCPVAMPVQAGRWSSCESGSTRSWNVLFGNGYLGSDGKYNSLRVRPVSAFLFF